MRIRYRIILTFSIVFAVSYGFLAALSIYLVVRSTEAAIVMQLGPWSRMLAEAPHQGVIVSKLKNEWNVETVVELRGILDPLSSNHPVEELERPLHTAEFGQGVAHIDLPGRRSYLVLRTPLRTPDNEPQSFVYLFYPEDILSKQKFEAAGPLLALTLVGLGSVLLMGFVVGRSIAQPIEEISNQAAAIRDLKSPIELSRTAAAEIRRLGQGLNDMLAALQSSQALAVEAEKGKLVKELAVSVAHEIKNPLQAIKMLIQMQAGLTPEDKLVLLNEIVRIELASLELLSVETPARPKLERVALGRIVEETLELLKKQMEHLKIRVTRELRSAPDIDGDPDRLKRVVMNLVLNGAQAMPQGGELVVRLGPGADASVRFSVTDHGAGVPEALRPRIFEPFVTTKGDGVGLGLFVTKRIVEAHRGAIGFDSRSGETTFYFELPCPTSS